MFNQGLISQEFEDIMKEYEIKINDNKLKIIIDDDEITFVLTMGISYYKYIAKYKYEEIIQELKITNYQNIEKVYEYLIKSEYKIIKDEKKLIINGNKEIKLIGKAITNEEMIKILIDEIKEIKDKYNKENDELERKYEQMNEKINELENIINSKDEINL